MAIATTAEATVWIQQRSNVVINHDLRDLDVIEANHTLETASALVSLLKTRLAIAADLFDSMKFTEVAAYHREVLK